LRWVAEYTDEAQTHALRVMKSDLARDHLKWRATILDHGARSFCPQPLDRLCRRLPGLGQKGAAELSTTQPGCLGQPFDRQCLDEMLPSKGKRAPDADGTGVKFQHGGELRLATGTAMINYQVTRNRFCGGKPKVLCSQSESEVDAGGDAG